MGDLAVLMNVELLEERLIEQSPNLRCRPLVGRVSVPRQFECPAEVLFDDIEGTGDSCQLTSRVLKLAHDALLVLPEEVKGDRLFVMQAQQLLAFVARRPYTQALHLLGSLGLLAPAESASVSTVLIASMRCGAS